MARPEQTTQSVICNPKSKIVVCECRGLGNDKPCVARVTLTRGYARFMRGYARLSAVRRANARFELFRVRLPVCSKLHQIAVFLSKAVDLPQKMDRPMESRFYFTR